jgi:hypothetical protein
MGLNLAADRAHDIIGSWPVDAGALMAPEA